MSGPTVACIGLGANLGDARGTVVAALAALARLPGTTLQSSSSLYRSTPIDAGGPDFVNAVARIETTLSPFDLLKALQGIEAEHGRARPYRNAPRTLDLDLLLYGDERIDSPELTVPHPRMHERAFVLIPLRDVAPDVDVPGRGSLSQCIARLGDQRIERLDE